MNRADYLEIAGEFLKFLNEKKVTIEDAENIAEMFNSMVKEAGEKNIEEYKNKRSVFFCSPPEK